MKTKTKPLQELTLAVPDTLAPNELTPDASVPNLDVERSRHEAGEAFINHVRKVFMRYQGKR